MAKTSVFLDFLKTLATERGVSGAELEVLNSALNNQPIAAISETLGISQVAVRKRLGEVYKKFKIEGSGPGKLAELKEILNKKYAEHQAADMQPHQDWGDAVDTGVFYGREKELAELERWIVDERCRLVAVLGMGGIGKTALVLRLAEQIQNQFQYVIWRSLLNPLPLEDLLKDLIVFLSEQQDLELPSTIDGWLSLLMERLRQHRCLIILDNAETIFRSDDLAGNYPEGREGYADLLEWIGIGRAGKDAHQSCLILTSREKPREVADQEGELLPVRSLQLSGLAMEEAKELLKVKGLTGSEADKRKLINRYIGNPLALKIASTTIRELFQGDIAQFLTQSTIVFGGIRNLLDQQFNRLSDQEKRVMYWLAINRDDQLSLPEMRSDILPVISQTELQEALQSLKKRSLVDNPGGVFQLQSVVMEHVITRLLEEACQEIVNLDLGFPAQTGEDHLKHPTALTPPGRMTVLRSHTLIKAQAKDYVRENQKEVILAPLVEQVGHILGSKQAIETQLNKMLFMLRGRSALETGYAGGNLLNLLCYLNVDLSQHDFSNLAIRQAYLQGVNLHGVNFSRSNLAKSVFDETFGNILSVAFSPDGKLLAMGDTRDTIRLWLVAENEQLFTCEGHSDWVQSVAFSPDSQILASGSDDCTVRLWDVTTGECLRIFPGHNHWVRSVAFSPDGLTLASSSDDKTVRLWEVETGKCLQDLSGHTSRVYAVAFSPDGKLLASGSADRTIRLWDTATGECLQMLQGHSRSVRSVTFNRAGSVLATGSSDRTIQLWARADADWLDVTPTPEQILFQASKTLKGHTDRVGSIVFSPDGSTLASGSDDHTVRIWDIKSEQCLEILREHTSRVWSVAFSTDGQMLASGSDDQTVRLWDTTTQQYSQTLRGYSTQICSVGFNPTGNRLVSGGDDRMVRLWDVETGQWLRDLPGHTSRVWSVTFSPNGRMLASSSDDQTIILWDVETGKPLKRLLEHRDLVRAVVFSPDGKQLASGSDDRTVRLWDSLTGQPITILGEHDEWVWSVVFSPNGRLLASAGGDRVIKLWDLELRSCIHIFKGHQNWIRTIAFSPDGRLLASGSGDCTVRLWDVLTGEPMQTLEGHSGQVRSVAFSPDGQTLASSGEDCLVKLWQVDTGKPLKTLRGHIDWVRAIAFSPDGHTLASGSKDETLRLWDVTSGKCLNTLRAQRPYEGMNITGVTGLSDTQKATLKALGAIELDP
jgi:WD40 repeat protein